MKLYSASRPRFSRRAQGSKHALLLSGVAIAALSSACDDGAVTGVDERGLIDRYIVKLGTLEVPPPTVETGDTSSAERKGDYSCTRTDVAETRNYDRLVAYSANSDSLWPGAIVGGRSLETGQLTQLNFERAPMGISVSLSNLTGGKSALIESPKLSTYRDAVAKILDSKLNGDTPANIYSEVEEVHSQKQLSMALGINVEMLAGGLANIGASFDFSNEKMHSRYLVKYTQAYYTVDVDQPTSPSAFFSDNVGLWDVKDVIPEGDPPMYVSSITYGRTVLFTFESEYSSTELGAALDFAYRGGADVSGNVSVNYKEMLSNSKITAYILGGSGAEAAKAIDSFENLMEFIRAGGNYSPASPGSPIAYKLNYLADNEPAKIALTEDFVVEDCSRVSQQVLVTLKNFYLEETADGSNKVEVFGNVGVTANNSGVLFDRDSGHNVQITESQSWPSSGSIAEFVLDVTPQPGQVIELHADLWDKDGFLNADDSLGNETVRISYEAGWRRDVPILLTGDSSKVWVNFSLQPI